MGTHYIFMIDGHEIGADSLDDLLAVIGAVRQENKEAFDEAEVTIKRLEAQLAERAVVQHQLGHEAIVNGLETRLRVAIDERDEARRETAEVRAAWHRKTRALGKIRREETRHDDSNPSHRLRPGR